jgi:hypothetical protein
MKNFRFLIFSSIIALSFQAQAMGSKKPVSEFIGNYRLSLGRTIEIQNGRDVACPEVLKIEAQQTHNDKGKLTNATLKAGGTTPLMSFEKVNLGQLWLNGNFFHRSSTNKNSITGEFGRVWMEPRFPDAPVAPGRPGRPGGAPELRQRIEYRYGIKQSGDEITLWTSASRDVCVYRSL